MVLCKVDSGDFCFLFIYFSIYLFYLLLLLFLRVSGQQKDSNRKIPTEEMPLHSQKIIVKKIIQNFSLVSLKLFPPSYSIVFVNQNISFPLNLTLSS